jgi:tyrosyl-tRNA synthetase
MCRFANVQGGGARVNDEQVQDIKFTVTAEAIKDQGGALKISMGKKKHAMVEIAA